MDIYQCCISTREARRTRYLILKKKRCKQNRHLKNATDQDIYRHRIFAKVARRTRYLTLKKKRWQNKNVEKATDLDIAQSIGQKRKTTTTTTLLITDTTLQAESKGKVDGMRKNPKRTRVEAYTTNSKQPCAFLGSGENESLTIQIPLFEDCTQQTNEDPISEATESNREQTNQKSRSRNQDKGAKKKRKPEILDFGAPNCICPNCNAIVWYEERNQKSWKPKKPRFSICCREGKIKLPPTRKPPTVLQNLLTGNGDTRSNKFKKNIRLYNSMFAFTSIGGRVDKSINDGGGPYCFRLNGQNHHKIGKLLPYKGTSPKFSQLYIFDTDNEISNRLDVVSKEGDRSHLDETIVLDLLKMLDENNHLVKAFRMARERIKEDQLLPIIIIIKNSRSADGREQNMPSTSEIAGLLHPDLENTVGIRDVIVSDKELGLTRISDLNPSFMALQYPLLFPYGEDGFRLGIKLNLKDREDNGKGRREYVTMTEYYAYILQQRIDQGQTLMLSASLLQVFMVDAFTCVEQDRLHWVQKNQPKIRCELYSGIRDAILRGDTDSSAIGHRIVLPSSFTGGPRYMQQNYQDAIALCKNLGNPDLFITITCNAQRPEITAALERMGGMRADERPDLVARCFKMRLDQLMEDLKKGEFFGKCLAGIIYLLS